MSTLPKRWTNSPLLSTVELHDSRRIPLNATERAKRKGQFPYYGANGLVDHIDSYIFDGEYVLLAEDGGNFDKPERGVAYEVSGKFWVNNHAHILRPRGDMPPRFLRYWLNALDWMPYVGGTTRAKLTQAGMAQITIPLPPLPEQRRIIAKLDSMTGRTARARDELERIPRLIQKYREAILAAAFSGELTREWREAKELPEWRRTTVADIATIIFDGPFGSNLKSVDYVDSGVRVIRLENIGHLRFIGEKETFISLGKYESLRRHILQADDVLFSSFVSEEIRVCLFPAGKFAPAINKADCFCIRVDRSQCDPRFLGFRLACRSTLEGLEELVHGATRPRVSLTQLKAYVLRIPSLPEQHEIVRRIETAFAWLDRVAAEHANASRLVPKLDQAILAKAFRGELVSLSAAIFNDRQTKPIHTISVGAEN